MKKILSDIATLLEAKHIKSSSHDVADMLWLAAIMDDHNHSASPENRTQEEPNPNRIPGDKGTDTKPKINNNELSPQNEKEDTASSSSSNPLYLNEHKDSGDKKGEYKKVPTPRLYTQYNQFANVLKILRQQSLSNTEKILDEDSTIEYIANTHIWDVVTKPKCEKKFTLNIIIEKSESMEIWEEITNDFSSAVANFLFFKALNVYYLKESNKGFVLYADKKCQTKVSVNAFHSLEERHLTMLMSDCISKAWGDKRGYDFLEKITRVTPFMILNMLPKRIWKRTIVDDTWRIKFTHKVGWLNKFLISDIDEEECQVSKEHIRVPMTTFDTISLKHWSNLIAGEKENWLYGSLFEAKWFNNLSNSFEDSQSDDDPVELVKNFEIFASPMAQKLAIYFSTVPLSLDIMKIVQKVSLPESNHTHLAEVFLSGLLKKTSMRTLSDKIIYEYVDGVRDVLKEKLYQHKKENILKDNISFVAKDLGATIDFIALIENPSLENGVSLGGIDDIVAEMVIDVFGEMNKDYSESTKKPQINLNSNKGLSFLKKLPSDYINRILQKNKIKHNNKIPFKLLLLYKGDSSLLYNDTIIETISNTFKKHDWHVDSRILNYEHSFNEQLREYEDITVDDCLFYYVGDVTLTKEDELFLLSNNIQVSFASMLKNIYTKFNNCNIAGVIDTCFNGNNTLNNINDDIELCIFNSMESKSYKYEASYYFCEAMNKSVDIVTLPYIGEYLKTKDTVGGYVLDKYTKHDFTKNIILADKTGSEKILFQYKNEINYKVYNEVILKKIPKAFMTLERERHLAEYLEKIVEYLIKHLNVKYPVRVSSTMSTTIYNISKDKHIKTVMMAINILSVEYAKKYLQQGYQNKLYDYIYAPAKRGVFDERPLLYSFKCIAFILPKHNEWLFDYLQKIQSYLEGFFKSSASLEFNDTGRIKVYIFVEIIDLLIKTELTIQNIPLWIFEFIERLKKVAISDSVHAIEKRDLYKHYYSLDYKNIHQELTLKDALDEKKLQKTNLKPKILWFDDKSENNIRERKMFENEGISFDIVLSTNEALNKIKDNNYFAIISYMGRKEGDPEGYVLLKELRDVNNHIPFFIYAGSNLQEYKYIAFEKGAQGSTDNSNELFKMVMEYLNNKPWSNTPTMVKIPKDEFTFGEAQDIRTYKIDYDIEVGKYPITVKEFKYFIEDSAYITEAEKGQGSYIWQKNGVIKLQQDASWEKPYFEQTDENPVVCITLKDIKAYILWINSKTNKTYRLPTEIEWEYMAFAMNSHPFGLSKNDKLEDFAWFHNNSFGGTYPVGHKHPNKWGLYDMIGNVWEWCEPEALKGGSWGSVKRRMNIRSKAERYNIHSDNKMGFRLVCTSDLVKSNKIETGYRENKHENSKDKSKGVIESFKNLKVLAHKLTFEGLKIAYYDEIYQNLLKIINDAFKDYTLDEEYLPEGLDELIVRKLQMPEKLEFTKLIQNKDTYILDMKFETEASVWMLVDRNHYDYFSLKSLHVTEHNKQYYSAESEEALYVEMSIEFKIDKNEKIKDLLIDSIDYVSLIEDEHLDEREQEIKDAISEDIINLLKTEHLQGLDYLQIYDESFPSDDNSAHISSYDLPEKIEIENIEITSNQFSVKVYLEQEVNLDINIFKADYYSNDDYVSLYTAVEDLNKHYVTVEGHELISIELNIKGTRDINIDSMDVLDIDIVNISVIEQIEPNETDDEILKYPHKIDEVVKWVFDNHENPISITLGELKEILVVEFKENFSNDFVEKILETIKLEYGYVDGIKKPDDTCKICKNTLHREYTHDGGESWWKCKNQQCVRYNIIVGVKYHP